MSPRSHFDRELTELRDEVLRMGLSVDEQLKLALQAVESFDTELAKQVIAADHDINQTRFDIEKMCSNLIIKQQPNARDLRVIIAAMNIIVDLERAGDQAKAIVNTIPQLLRSPKRLRPEELSRMGALVRALLQQCMQAYADNATDLAEQIADKAKEADALFGTILNTTIEDFAKQKKEKKVTASFGFLYAAQHLNRVSDLAVNVAERIIYISTGDVEEMKVHTSSIDE